ncbi:MAG TPA: TetR/AcrR family transcriptional regulator [Terracidiphilus sp.]|nr:TetR/AcrR family transcriptional regulator [Terracidiphilus sp.]
MSLRNSVRTEKIVEAAAKLFAQQGYHGTSTREIARLAEVSENTVFRHFDHKEDIFWSALRSTVTAIRPRWELFREIKSGEAPGVVLPKILELLAETISYKPDVIRLIAVAFVELHGQAEVLCRDLIPLFSEISQYLAMSVEKGEVKEVDPTILASSLMAMVLIHPQLARMVDISKAGGLSNRDTINAYSKFWLDVLTPKLSVSSAQAVSGIGEAAG